MLGSLGRGSMTTETADAAIAFERTREDQAWARWLARSADRLLLMPFVFVAFFALGLLIELERAPAVILDWLEQPILAVVIETLIVFVLFALWEPLFLSNTGTTPGKWLMGVRVRSKSGEKLSLLRALDRFVRVWFVGMGAGIPVLIVILTLMARARLVGDGVTAWDESLDCEVQHTKRHPLVWALVIILVIAANIGLVLLSRLGAEGD